TAQSWYDTVFTTYATICNEKYPKQYIANYLSSHDDGDPFDKKRTKGFESANKLLLSPGIAQIYYGDESNRDINVPADGDATLRSFMNWDQMQSDATTKEVFSHWQKLGKFRRKHDAVTKGSIRVISSIPYLDVRSTTNSTVFIALDQNIGQKSLNVGDWISDHTELIDEYSGQKVKVKGGIVSLNSPFSTVLLSKL
nr:hypothetical protein [Saprospiraceae bacterium]